jgi:hypothetical protein
LTKKNIKAVPSNFHPVLTIPISGCPFVVDDKPYDKILKTSFIYFCNLGYPRPVEAQIQSNGNWEFLRKNDPEQRAIADFKIQQNGSASGRCVLSTDPNFVLAKKSKIYTDFYILVKPEFKPKLKTIQTALNAYEYTFSNLTTWRSLGKNRVAEALNSIIK